jgi:hypothetical protein
MFKPLGGSLTQEIVCLTGKWTFDIDATCDLTSGAATVGIDSTSLLSVGMLVDDVLSGTDVPAGTTIISVDSATQFTMSANAAGSATNTTLQFVGLSGARGFSVGKMKNSGLQVITLEDAYNELLGVTLTYGADVNYTGTEGTNMLLASEGVSTTKLITLLHINSATGAVQTEANLAGNASGVTIRCMIWLKNSSV